MHAAELGLTQKDVVDNVITALNSNYMIAPNYWVDHKSGNDYYLTVQYFEKGALPSTTSIDLGKSRCGLQPARSRQPWTTLLSEDVQTPTEVDHYQIQRVIDLYVTPAGEDLGASPPRSTRS